VIEERQVGRKVFFRRKCTQKRVSIKEEKQFRGRESISEKSKPE
jgi:hypothetical protein